MSAEATVQLCSFYVGAQEYALDIMRIEEILQPPPVTPVPRAPPVVEGVVNLRGVILPVVDLRRQLEAGAPPPKLKPKLMVCWVGRRRVGVLVDGVSDVVRLRPSDIKPAPALATGAVDPFVVGVCGPPDRLKLLLSLKALLRLSSPAGVKGPT
ncbi:MAG: chemotaxis protein CheW [Myxococcota bacterium]